MAKKNAKEHIAMRMSDLIVKKRDGQALTTERSAI